MATYNRARGSAVASFLGCVFVVFYGMEVISHVVFQKLEGIYDLLKHFKSNVLHPLPFLSLLATVVRTVQRAKTVRFLHVAFDATGDVFLAGDHHGNVYVFDIGRNRYDSERDNQGLLASPDLLSHMISLWADSIWCRKQDRPALLWLSTSAEPQSCLWPWVITL